MSKKKKIAKKNSKQAYMEKKVAIANIMASKRQKINIKTENTQTSTKIKKEQIAPSKQEYPSVPFLVFKDEQLAPALRENMLGKQIAPSKTILFSDIRGNENDKTVQVIDPEGELLYKQLMKVKNNLLKAKGAQDAKRQYTAMTQLFVNLQFNVIEYINNNKEYTQKIKSLLYEIDKIISFPLIWNYNPEATFQSVRETFLGETFLYEDVKNIQKNKEDGIVDCVFISDEGYVNATLIAINSILQSKSPKTNIRISIVSAALSDEAKRKFKLWERKDFIIDIVQINSEFLEGLSKLHKYEEGGHCMATPAALLKFFLPKIFNNLSKILYLDGDVIVRKDLKELFDIELDEYYVAAVTDAWSLVNDTPQIRKFGRWLFNSGVMLLNLKKLREDNITELLVEAKTKSTDYSLMDQHILNSNFAGNVLFLPYKYNALPIWYFRHNSKLQGDIWERKAKLFYGKSIQKQENFADDSVVIAHFAGSDKPWKNNNIPFASEWLKCKNEVLEKLVKNPKNNVPFVSIIVPVYNAGLYLHECLSSLLKQTLKNIEIICINDCSTDNSLSILKEYARKDNRIKIINNAINLGSAASRNKGIALATGEYVGFVDSDDYISLDYYDNLFKNAILFNADIAATSKAYVFFEDGKGFYKNLGLDNKSNISDIKDKGTIITRTGVSCNKIYKKQFLLDNNIKCLELKNAAEDNYFTDCVIIMANMIAVSHEPIYYYRNNSVSQTKKLKDASHFSMIQVYQEIDNFIMNKKFSNTIEKEWLNIIRQRKRIEFFEFINTMDEKCIDEFKRLFFNTFPDLRNIIKEIIISLTSYPARIHTVNQTIETLLNQSKKADKVILWLSPEQFPNKEADLPQNLLDLRKNGLIIDWYQDIRSYKKLIPTLKKFPDSIIITADDDILYPQDWLESLYREYCEDPNTIWCHRAHKIKMKYNTISPYNDWDFSIDKNKSSCLNFCTSGGGVLYPPHCFYQDILDEDKFLTIAPCADDLWFWAMLVLNNKRINVIRNNMKSLKLIDGSQDIALWQGNVINKQNDIQMKEIIRQYPQIIKILKKEQPKISLNICLRLPFLLFQIYKLRSRLKEHWINFIKEDLTSSRIDIRNFGKGTNDLEVQTDTARVCDISWNTSKGGGKIVQDNNLSYKIKLKVIGNGTLQIDFRGREKRYCRDRLPLWIDYKSIKIDGKEILPTPIATWHDKPYRYEMLVKDGQNITLEIEQQYHQYIEDEIKDIIIKLSKNSDFVEEHSDIVMKNFKKIIPTISKKEFERKKLEYTISDIKSQLLSSRIDIRNFGKGTNDLEVQTDTARVCDISWNTSKGGGKIVQDNNLSYKIKLKVIGNGTLQIDFRGQEKRYCRDRLPLWIDYKSIKIDGKEILPTPIATWNDKPYRYEMLVKDGQNITLEIEQQYHQYIEDEIKDIIIKLSKNSDFVEEYIDNIIEKIRKDIGLKIIEYTWDYVKNNVLKQLPQEISINEINNKTKGRITILLESTKFESVLIPSKTKKLYVFLSSGGKDVPYPIFHRIPSFESYNGIRVFFDDPTRNELNENNISWYLGKKGQYLDYLAQIITKISEIYQIKYSDITLIGSSNAGFASMQLANRLKGVNCIALNPQLSIKLYLGEATEDFAKKIDIDFDNPQYKDIVCSDCFIENDKSKFFLFFNQKSKLDMLQIIYLEMIIKKKLSIGLHKIRDNFLCGIVKINATKPHNVVPQEHFIQVLCDLLESPFTQKSKDRYNSCVKELRKFWEQSNQLEELGKGAN